MSVDENTPASSAGDGRPEIVTRHRGLMGRTVLVSVLTLFSRLLGFVREVVMASLFGDGSAISDAFFTAWRVPNLFRRLFGEGALSTSLQAGLTEADAAAGDEGGRWLFLRTIKLMSGVLFFASALAMVVVSLLPDQMPVTGWAWFGTDPGPVRDLSVRVLPYVVLVCLAALSGGALHVRGHYAIPNLAPTIMNLTWIAALVSVGYAFGWSQSAEGTRSIVLARQWDMARVLAWGVLAGGVIQLAVHIPPLLRFGLLRNDGTTPPAGAPGRTGVPGPGSVLLAAAPLALGAAVYQINVMIDGLMAEGLLADGGPSALYYANRVQQFPLALIAIAATNAVFPLLKARAHLGELVELRKLHDRAQAGIVFLALPAAAGLWVLARPIASVLFEHGNYGSAGGERISAALEMLAIALVPAGAAGLLGRTYIARNDARTPVRISICMMALNIGLNVLFVRGLGMDVDGLALATAFSSWGNLAWLALGMRTRLGLPGGEPGAVGRLLKKAGAAAACGFVAWSGHSAGAALELAPVPALILSITLGIAAYVAFARLLAIPELALLRERFGRRSRGR